MPYSMLIIQVYPWNAEKDGALVIDMGGGVGAATLPIINQVSKLKLQVQDLPAVEPQFQQVSVLTVFPNGEAIKLEMRKQTHNFLILSVPEARVSRGSQL